MTTKKIVTGTLVVFVSIVILVNVTIFLWLGHTIIPQVQKLTSEMPDAPPARAKARKAKPMEAKPSHSLGTSAVAGKAS